jgi:hypothetical protein
MLQDVNTIFSGAIAASGTRTAQAITATANSTNVLDTRQSGLPALVDLGVGYPTVWLIVNVVQVFNTLTSLQIDLVSDSASSLASSPVTHFSKTVLLAGLTAGAQVVRVQIPSDDYKEYLGVKYTVNGSNPTTGSVYAFLTMDPQRNVGYPGAFTLDV